MEEISLEQAPQFAAPSPKRKINKRFIYLLSAIVLLVLLFAGYKLLGSQKSTSTSSSIISTPTPTEFILPTDTPAPTDSPTLTPTNTPTPPASDPVDKATGLDRSKLTIIVQNGSGEAGVAKTGSDLLENLGYDVTSTSNADNFDYTNVTIQVKSTFSKYLPLLKKDLSAKYTVDETSSDLDTSVSSDAVVIIGK